LIDRAYLEGEAHGLAVWVEDEAGPYQALPQPGQRWWAADTPARQPHDYLRGNPAKLLTLFHPKTGELRAQGVTSRTNALLHPWLEKELETVLARLPRRVDPDMRLNRHNWETWQVGLSVKFTLPEVLPPLQALLVLDNLAGHKTPAFVLGLVAHGVMPLDTPLSGSWLNTVRAARTGGTPVRDGMAESIQRIIIRRALAGTPRESSTQTIDALEATVRGWNRCPTPFTWGGQRKARRDRARARRLGHHLGGSGAIVSQSPPECQTTH
jgi:hypothetical protein